ncbi:uncharacterized protein LOC143297092 [Babylonia areolata]|uniref:uncharacterized protein LOC143297092 n=1 Tax=Babylonia areolata TaxID=304850 RepID=UPI003FD1F3CD
MAAPLDALFGGHISGRRLRGVKINPIYQGSEPGVLERSPADTQSESALPIGEIQIEVYDSLPRSGQRPFRQSRSSPVIAARGLSVGRGSEEGGGNSSRPPGRDTCVSAARSEVRKVEDVRLSPTVSSAMDVDNVPWTFLQDRSPVQRQPLWGAFWGPGTPTPTHPPHSHQPPPGTGDRQTSFQTRTKSSSSLFVVPPPDKIDVIGDESSDEDVGSVKTPGAEERCETRSGEENRPDGVNSSSGVKNAVSVEQSATCFAADASSERVDVAPPHNSSLNEKTQSEASLTSREYVYSDFVHFAEHNCHHYSGYDILDSRPASLNDISERLPLTHHPTQGGNGLSLSGVFPVLKAHTMCTCPCHSRKSSQDSMTVMAGSDTQTECVDGKKATQETSPQANEISNVKSLLCSDSILLRADELNAPAYLQRYLLEAQKHYLQQNPYPATIPTYSDLPSSAHPTSDNADATTAANDNNNDDDDAIPRELLDFLAAEDDLALNGGDAVSVVEELGSQRTKSASWKKSFRSTGSGRSGAASTNSKTDSRQSSRTGKHSSIEDLDAEDGWWWAAAGEGVGSVWGGSGGSSNRSSSLVDRNENLKKAGLSIIHVEGNSTDPGFEMIVPYEASDEELDSNYSSRRRRQRREELAEQSSWKGEKVSMRERLIKAGLITLIFGVLVGIFIGVVIHFSKESKGGEEGADVEGGLLPHGGSFHGFRR